MTTRITPATASRPDRSKRYECPGSDVPSGLPARQVFTPPDAVVRQFHDTSALASQQPPASPAVRVPLASGLHPLLTIEQVASALGVSPKTVRRLIARGFPHVRFGRVLRFDPADVQRWIVARSS